MEPITTYAETVYARQELTPDQRAVYDILNSLLYAEPFFSDVQGEDIAHESIYTAQQVGGYVKALIDAGLVYVEYTDANMRKRQFIHTHAHDAGLVRNGALVEPHEEPPYDELTLGELACPSPGEPH